MKKLIITHGKQKKIIECLEKNSEQIVRFELQTNRKFQNKKAFKRTNLIISCS